MNEIGSSEWSEWSDELETHPFAPGLPGATGKLRDPGAAKLVIQHSYGPNPWNIPPCLVGKSGKPSSKRNWDDLKYAGQQ